MTAAYHYEIDDLVQKAHVLPYSPTRLSLLQEAVRIADAHQDLETAFDLREELEQTAAFCGAPEALLVSFTWRLGQCDRHPERFGERDLLWHYKWVAGKFRHFPQISRAQIEEMLEDMTRRYRRQGHGLRAVYKLRYLIARGMGDRELARRMRRKWQSLAIGRGNDCPACELNHEVDYDVHIGRFAQAVEKAQPILEGRLSCEAIPHGTYATVLLPLLRLGRLDEGDEYQRRGYRLIANNPAFLEEVSLHLSYLSQRRNLAAALKLFEKHLPWALETRAAAHTFEFLVPGLTLLEALAETKPDARLRLPPDWHGESPAEPASVASLRDWGLKKCSDLAEAFDRRNGNDYFARRLARREIDEVWLAGRSGE